MLTLFPDQQAAVDQLREAIAQGKRNILLVAPTGSGKTVAGSYLISASQAKRRRSNFVVDRLSLINQTSETFDRYGIAHGVMQGEHWRFRPSELTQLCSIQTVRKRGWPESQLDLIDEAHTIDREVVARLAKKERVSIGLTATPFTKGLGAIYEHVVTVTTTAALIEQGRLSPYRIYACTEPDMEGVKVRDGKWNPKETEKRALAVVGDVVAEYLEKGEGRKFICSAVDTAHVEELQRKFLAAGINCVTYTYKDQTEDRDDAVREFRKPNSTIRGLITVTAASKGFDVPDISCVIMARPLRNSLAEFIQFFGRGLRTAPGKFDCIILDHSGNCERFWHEWTAYFETGEFELDDGTKKAKPKPKPAAEKEPMKCPACRGLHPPMPFCPSCGHEYPKRAAVQHVAGTLKELLAGGSRRELTQALWPQVCGYVHQRPAEPDRMKARALALYKNLTKQWPERDFHSTEPVDPTPEVANKIRSLNIRWAKSKSRQGAAA